MLPAWYGWGRNKTYTHKNSKLCSHNTHKKSENEHLNLKNIRVISTYISNILLSEITDKICEKSQWYYVSATNGV